MTKADIIKWESELENGLRIGKQSKKQDLKTKILKTMARKEEK